jgi:hypothetical protein
VRFEQRSDNLNRSVAVTRQMKRQPVENVGLLRACPNPSHNSNFRNKSKQKKQRNQQRHKPSPTRPGYANSPSGCALSSAKTTSKGAWFKHAK